LNFGLTFLLFQLYC